MIDRNMLREQVEFLITACKNRGDKTDIVSLVDLDAEVRCLKHDSEALRAQAKADAIRIGQMIRIEKLDPLTKCLLELRQQAGEKSEEASAKETDAKAKDAELSEKLLYIPNPCLPEVPIGADASQNPVHSTWGQVPKFAFAPLPHWELATKTGIMDFERGTKLAGSGFVVLRADGARLQRALVSFFLDRHRQWGYEEVAVPYLVKTEIMQGTGQLPKFSEQLYRAERDDLWLIPTAEVPVTNLYAGEILDAKDLPKRFACHTPCFRREAGAAGIGTRGMTRVHQFDKVEMVWLTTPDRSRQDLETMRGHAETLLQDLGLHHRVLHLCTGDTGFSSACTFDLEVWSPGTNGWLEVSSCSTFTDFQARRMGLRYRPEPNAKPVPVHTINGSGLALPRCLIALVETYQQADGSISIPEVLRPYLGGQTKIG